MMETSSRPELHTRSKSGFSFRSHKSSDSGNTKPKIDLHETEKERRKAKFSGAGFSTSNPNKAISEAQPALIAQEQSTISPLRDIQHKDWQGNVITDPDPSNPSRPRLERPLDTIRSFEAAIDDGHKRRTQMLRAESATGGSVQGGDSRRNSFVGKRAFGGKGDPAQMLNNRAAGSDINIHPRSPAAIPGPNYYSAGGSRRSSFQQDGYHQYPRGPPSAYRRGAGARMSSAPLYLRPQQPEYNGYPHHSYNESYDTTGESSGSPSEPWGTSTDPSSENSSIDRIHHIKQPENDAYGPQYDRGSPRNGPIAEDGERYNGPLRDAHHGPRNNGPPPAQQHPRPNRDFGPGQMRNAQPQVGPQPPYQPRPNPQPDHQPSQRRSVIPLGEPAALPKANGQMRPAHPQQQKPNALRKKPAEPAKRQSWIKRAFGRS